MTQDPAGSAPAPDAFNGNAPASQQTAQAASAIAAMLADLPRTLAGLLAQVAQSIPGVHLCAQCVTTRVTWGAAHQEAVEHAAAAACAAAGLPPGSPADPVPFLPEDLRPGARDGIPAVRAAVTTVNGTECCPEHVPGQPSQRGRALLVAQGALSPSALMQFAQP